MSSVVQALSWRSLHALLSLGFFRESCAENVLVVANTVNKGCGRYTSQWFSRGDISIQVWNPANPLLPSLAPTRIEHQSLDTHGSLTLD